MTTEWLVIILALLAGAIGVGSAVGWWLTIQNVRQERRRIAAESEPIDDDVLTLPVPSVTVQPPTEPRINWGDVSDIDLYANALPRPEARIEWGAIEEVYTDTITPEQESEVETQCPVCKDSVEQGGDQIFLCPTSSCRTIYHQECWAYINAKCKFCGVEAS